MAGGEPKPLRNPDLPGATWPFERVEVPPGAIDINGDDLRERQARARGRR